MLDHGADPNVHNSGGYTPLHNGMRVLIMYMSCLYCFLLVLLCIVFDVCDLFYIVILVVVVLCDCVIILVYLILGLAFMKGQVKIVILLLVYNANINAASATGMIVFVVMWG